MGKKNKEHVPLRVKICTVLSAIVLTTVCAMELIEFPFKNELWFGVIVLALLGGCLLLMSWSFGMFDREK